MNFDLRFYARLLVRRAPVMLVLLLVCSAVGIVLAMRLPTTYETSARMLVQPPQIAEDLAVSTVQINALEEVRLLREQLLTRANLLEIADDHSVFEDRDQMLPDEIVNEMRNATEIEAWGGESRRSGPQPVLVSVTFEARTPQIVADVVNDYVTRMTAENVRIRTGNAGETLDFFEQQVQRLGTELDLRSARIEEFQRENSSALPGDQAYRLQRLSLLQERMSAGERERRGLIQSRTRTLEVFEATGSITADNGTTRLTPEQRELEELERELSRALTVYSETAPQVQQIQRQVEALRNEVASAQVPIAGTDQDISGAEAILNLQLAELDSRIETIDTLLREFETEAADLEVAIQATPLNTITLQGLERDYENIRIQYDNAVQRLAAAATGSLIEDTARGQRIRLIEPASVPTSPASPNRPFIAVAGVGTGLGLAAAFFLLLELLNKTVRRPIEISNRLGITPLATVPYLESRTDRVLRRSMRVAAALVVLTGVPAALWALDTYYLPLDLLADRVLDRLGLS